jgi:DNA-binding PadR family transcriptional regulator
MERKGFNVLKREVLEIMKDGKSHTSPQVRPMILGSQRTNICDCLKRLYDNGLLEREKLPQTTPGRPTFQYIIHVRGLERLEYWKEKEKPRRKRRGVPE